MVGDGSVFVTVGTTLFDALIEAVDSKYVQETILEKGYTSLVIQIGRGKHIPREYSVMTRILGCIKGTTRVAELRTGIPVGWSLQVTPDCASAILPVEHFTFTPSLAEYVKAASLVISHAGSGSIFESLRAGKAVVVVVNEALMDNHQRELADVLAAERHLVCATPQSLGEVLASSDFSILKPYPPSEEGQFARALDSFFGFPN